MKGLFQFSVSHRRRRSAHADKGGDLVTSFKVGDGADPPVNILQSGQFFLQFFNLC